MIYDDEIHLISLHFKWRILEHGRSHWAKKRGWKRVKERKEKAKESVEERGDATCTHCVPIFIIIPNFLAFEQYVCC
jgi:hypothetical protein